MNKQASVVDISHTHSSSDPSASRHHHMVPRISDVAQSKGAAHFLLEGGLVDALFIRRSDVLLVTFDNLGTVGKYEHPRPWLASVAEAAGVSNLGMIARQKDWYRNEDTPRLIRSLRETGFFGEFKRVIFCGASMGGYAALTYSALLPGSVVLAFSAQSSLARELVPFEGRYRYDARKWDWHSLPFRDAAEALPHASRVHLIYDPFVAEDRAHASRLTGENVVQLHAPHMGHRAIRYLKAFGMLPWIVQEVVQDQFDRREFARRLRMRRQNIDWQRNVLAEAESRGHKRLVISATERLALDYPESGFARRHLKRLRKGQS